MMRFSSVALMRLAVLGVVLPATSTFTARADTLLAPSATILLGASASQTTYATLDQSYTQSGALGVDSAGNSTGLDPSVTVSSKALQVPTSSYSLLLYEFAVDGPANQIVGLTITGSGQENSSGAASAEAILEIFLSDDSASAYQDANSQTPLLCGTAGYGPCGSGASGFNISQTLNVQTNTDYIVALIAQASSNGLGSSASASVDPTITLDANNPSYSLEFSPGLVSATPTPEPSSLALLATGLAGCGSLIRRRFRQA